MTPEDLVALPHARLRSRGGTPIALEPIPREGGLFRRTWEGPARPDGRPSGTAIVALLTAEPDDFSALHRLSGDEVWHFYLGDPLRMLLLAPDGGSRTVVLGPDMPGGAWTFFGCTTAPGFTYEDYEHGDAEHLLARYPHEAARIVELCRP